MFYVKLFFINCNCIVENDNCGLLVIQPTSFNWIVFSPVEVAKRIVNLIAVIISYSFSAFWSWKKLLTLKIVFYFIYDR